jgi:hypothetical protein
MAKFVQPIKDPWFESLQDRAICVFDLPVCPGVHYGRPIHADMVIVAESKELFSMNCEPLSVMMEFGTQSGG